MLLKYIGVSDDEPFAQIGFNLLLILFAGVLILYLLDDIIEITEQY